MGSIFLSGHESVNIGLFFLRVYIRHYRVCGTETSIPIPSFPCPVLLNANRAGSTSKQAPLGVEGRSEATVYIFKLCAWPLDPLNPHSVIYM